MKKNERKSKGITLIALVITIIILLILAGIAILALTGSNGLFARAKDARNNTLIAKEQEEDIINGYNSAIASALGETLSREETLVSKVENNTIKIGDYIKYTPTEAKTTDILSELGIYSGNIDDTKNTSSTLTQEMDLNWRVLDVNDGKVRLISATPTTSTITLYGPKGYNNAVYLLDKVAKTLYNNATYASDVKNLKIEDIQEKIDISKYDYTQYANSNVDTGRYGGFSKTPYPYATIKNYPSIYAQEKNNGIGGTKSTTATLGLSEQTNYLTEELGPRTTSLGVTQTFWYKSMETTHFVNQKYYQLYINNGSIYPTYWMSSRCVSANSDYAIFYVRIVNFGRVEGYYLYFSSNNSYSNSYAFRPVITLKSDVQVKMDNSKDGTTAEKAYELKAQENHD